MEGLSVRARNTLARSRIRTLEDLLQVDLERLKVGGLKTQKEILEYRKDIEEGENDKN
jgi:hypothetical protein